MIPRKRKVCKQCNTPQFLFSDGLCKNCYGRNKAVLATLKHEWGQPPPWQRKSSNKAQKPIKARSDKRKLEEMRYKMVCDLIDADAEEWGQMGCFFCGKKVVNAEHHHLKGRDGDLLTDRRYIKRVHTQCHYDYHNVSVHKIQWWDEYLATLLRDGEDVLYNIEKEKLNK